MWNDISKYDVMSIFHDVDGEEVKVQGEVYNITHSHISIRDGDGTYHIIERDNLIDIHDHIRNEDNEVYRH